MKKSVIPDQSVLHSLLDYNPTTSKLFWKIRDETHFHRTADMLMWNKRFANKEAFTSKDDKGYYRGAILSKSYLAHRVIFKYLHGYDPDQVDHDDRNPSNNKAINLIDASATKNSRNSKLYSNNTTGTTGVCWDKARNMWIASIIVDYQQKHLGRFTDLKDAITARKAAEVIHGFHPNHGQ